MQTHMVTYYSNVFIVCSKTSVRKAKNSNKNTRKDLFGNLQSSKIVIIVFEINCYVFFIQFSEIKFVGSAASIGAQLPVTIRLSLRVPNRVDDTENQVRPFHYLRKMKFHPGFIRSPNCKQSTISLEVFNAKISRDITLK